MIKKSKIQNKSPELKSINNVEIFSAGKWNGDNYTESDLDEMVKAFDETSQDFQPYLKLSHDEGQALLKAEELPAAGYIANLKRVGQKLVADFVDIPEKIYFLMKNKAFRNRSSEIFWDIDFNGKTFKRMLKAVALLGADMPAVSTLDDIINFYGLDPKKARDKKASSVILKVCRLDENQNKEDEMSEKLEKKITELESAADLKAKEYSKKEKDNADKLALALKKNEELEAKQREIEIEAATQELKHFAESLVSEKLATPSMKPLVEKLFGDDAKEYSIVQVIKKEGQEDENLEKKYTSKRELLKEILKLNSEASKVNFDENSEDVKPEKGDKDDILNMKIEKYSSENKVSYSDAYKAIIKTTNEE